MFYELYWNFIKKNWKLYIIYFILLLSIPLETTAIPHYYGEIINILKKGDFVAGKTAFLTLLGIWIIIQTFNLANSYLNTYLMPKFQSYIRQYFFNKIIDSYSQDYKELELGQIIAKIIRSPGIIQNIFVEIRDFVFRNMFVTGANTIYLSYHHPLLGGIFLACIGVIYITSYFYYNSCHGYVKKTEDAYDKVHEQIQDTLTNLLSIYTCQKSKDEKKRVEGFNDTTSKSQTETGMCNNKFRVIFSILYIIVFLALNYGAYYLYKQGKIKLKAIVSIFILNYSIFGHLSDFYYDAYAFMNVYTKVDHITNFIDSMPSIGKDKGEKIKNPKEITIEFKDVYFSHPNTKKPIYEDLNLVIPPRQNLAIMGSIGSGKSTAMKLLVRLQKHQKGDILINGSNLNNLDLNNVRKNIIYVPQHPILFNRTLWDNLSYGIEGIKPEDVYKILKDNGLNDIEKVYREKMYKEVGKLGSNLSGGQKQLVWLIRCMLRPSNVIILDEPTSALDENSRRNVENVIKALSKTRTLIIITHDKELLQHMDRMIYFDKGKIIQDEMLKKRK
jgi:ABC-type multidrug transport system fused ATPase/permease subunit